MFPANGLYFSLLSIFYFWPLFRFRYFDFKCGKREPQSARFWRRDFEQSLTLYLIKGITSGPPYLRQMRIKGNTIENIWIKIITCLLAFRHYVNRIFPFLSIVIFRWCVRMKKYLSLISFLSWFKLESFGPVSTVSRHFDRRSVRVNKLPHGFDINWN